jgi:hypothetical protein
MPSVIARQLDDRGRLVMPKECPPGTAVTIQQLDPETWIVKAQHPRPGFKVIAVPIIDRLPDDPAWEEMERKAALHLSKNVPPFEE